MLGALYTGFAVRKSLSNFISLRKQEQIEINLLLADVTAEARRLSSFSASREQPPKVNYFEENIANSAFPKRTCLILVTALSACYCFRKGPYCTHESVRTICCHSLSPHPARNHQAKVNNFEGKAGAMAAHSLLRCLEAAASSANALNNPHASFALPPHLPNLLQHSLASVCRIRRPPRLRMTSHHRLLGSGRRAPPRWCSSRHPKTSSATRMVMARWSRTTF